MQISVKQTPGFNGMWQVSNCSRKHKRIPHHLSSLQRPGWLLLFALLWRELLHSELVATADLLRRVHARTLAVRRPHGLILPGCHGASADNMQDDGLSGCSCRRQRSGVVGGGDGAGPRTVDAYLGSVQINLDPRENRVWLQQILYVWRRRRRHGAESHSERTVQREGRRRIGIRNKPPEEKYVRVRSSLLSFCLSPQHLCRSLRIRDVTTWWWSAAFLRARPRSNRPSQQLGHARRGL